MGDSVLGVEHAEDRRESELGPSRRLVNSEQGLHRTVEPAHVAEERDQGARPDPPVEDERAARAQHRDAPEVAPERARAYEARALPHAPRTSCCASVT